MTRHDNYPDDIRNFDDCPGSPYYVDPSEALYDARDALVDAWRAEYDLTGVVGWFGGNPRDEALDSEETLGAILDRFALLEVEQNPPTEDGW